MRPFVTELFKGTDKSSYCRTPYTSHRYNIMYISIHFGTVKAIKIIFVCHNITHYYGLVKETCKHAKIYEREKFKLKIISIVVKLAKNLNVKK
jgi:hypothetical protein